MPWLTTSPTPPTRIIEGCEAANAGAHVVFCDPLWDPDAKPHSTMDDVFRKSLLEWRMGGGLRLACRPCVRVYHGTIDGTVSIVAFHCPTNQCTLNSRDKKAQTSRCSMGR